MGGEEARSCGLGRPRRLVCRGHGDVAVPGEARRAMTPMKHALASMPIRSSPAWGGGRRLAGLPCSVWMPIPMAARAAGPARGEWPLPTIPRSAARRGGPGIIPLAACVSVAAAVRQEEQWRRGSPPGCGPQEGRPSAAPPSGRRRASTGSPTTWRRAGTIAAGSPFECPV